MRFPHISVVLLVSGAHYTQMTPTLIGMPLLIMPSVVLEANRVAEFVSELNAKWSVFDGQQLFHMPTELIPKLDYKRLSDDFKNRHGR